MGLLNKIFKKNETVYIAYDKRDENIAKDICEVLEYNGLSCWMKSRDSLNNNVMEIVQAIMDSGLCVVIYSENSRESRFVITEVDTAFSESVPRCIFKTDVAPIDGSMEFFLNSAPCIEANPNYADHLQSLTEACLKSLEKSAKNIRIPEKIKRNLSPDAFISYSTKDTDIADRICAMLEDNGIKCWIAPRDLESGKNFSEQISRAVKYAKIYFAVFTKSFQESQFAKKELEIAFYAEKPIFSLRADESLPEDDCAFFLKTAQWIGDTQDLDHALADAVRQAAQATNTIDQEPSASKVGGEIQTAHDIFISYHSMDTDVASELCEKLESNGFKCCFVQKDNKTSEDYAKEIYDGLNGSNIFVSVFSKHYQESEHTKEELEIAFSNEKPIVAFRLNSLTRRILRIYLKNAQCVDAEEDLEAGYESIIQTASAMLGRPLARNEPDESTSKQKPDIMLSAISDTVVCGNVIALSGSLKLGDDALSRANVDIYKKDDLVDTVVTSNAGKFSLLTATTDIETLEFKAIFKGNDLYDGCESVTVSIDVIEAENQSEKPQNDGPKIPPRAYMGDEPYVFVCYSHSDSEVVLGEIERFQSMGYNIWYDEGFTLGNEWDEETAKALVNSSAFIAFTSQNSIKSTDVENEINLASDKGIPILNIRLEETEIPLRLELKLSGTYVEKYNMDDDKYMFKCISAFKEFGIESRKTDEIEEFLATFSEDDDEFGFRNDETIPHVDETPFPAYEGEDAYAFVSYSHKDYEFVFNEIDRFRRQGLNIWYDEGIAPGNEWLAEIGTALSGASLFIVFISENSVSSKFVKKEITYAIKYDIPFVAIHIENTQLPNDLDLALGDLQAILQYGMNDGEYYRRYTKAFNIHLRDHGIRLKRVDEIE